MEQRNAIEVKRCRHGDGLMSIIRVESIKMAACILMVIVGAQITTSIRFDALTVARFCLLRGRQSRLSLKLKRNSSVMWIQHGITFHSLKCFENNYRCFDMQPLILCLLFANSWYILRWIIHFPLHIILNQSDLLDHCNRLLTNHHEIEITIKNSRGLAHELIENVHSI